MLDLGERHLTDLPGLEPPALTSEIVRIGHRLHELDLFSDESIEQILDRHPRDRLMAFTMGSDPTRPEEWTLVDSREATGRELVTAARAGRLWFNVVGAHAHDDRLAALRDELINELRIAVPDLVPESVSFTLLVSSRDAMVYYHADAGPNMLLHIRGHKRVHVFPPLDPELADPRLMEDIFAGVRIENLPYRSEFESRAQVYELAPGELIAWPQNSPHRVVNMDSANVSLSVEFATARSERRVHTWAANRFFSRTLHIPSRSTKETGLWSWCKRFGHRVGRKLRFDRTAREHAFVTSARVDPTSPDGTRQLDEAITLTY